MSRCVQADFEATNAGKVVLNWSQTSLLAAASLNIGHEEA
jgi:hypothetical protein